MIRHRFDCKRHATKNFRFNLISEGEVIQYRSSSNQAAILTKIQAATLLENDLQCRSYGNVIGLYNYSAIFAISEFRKCFPLNIALQKCCQMSEDILKHLSSKMRKLNGRSYKFSNFPLQILKNRADAIKMVPFILENPMSNMELRAFGGCLLVTLPPSKSIWSVIDHKISEMVMSYSVESYVSSLLVYQAYLKVKEMNAWRMHSLAKIPDAIYTRLSIELESEVDPLHIKYFCVQTIEEERALQPR